LTAYLGYPVLLFAIDIVRAEGGVVKKHFDGIRAGASQPSDRPVLEQTGKTTRHRFVVAARFVCEKQTRTFLSLSSGLKTVLWIKENRRRIGSKCAADRFLE